MHDYSWPEDGLLRLLTGRPRIRPAIGDDDDRAIGEAVRASALRVMLVVGERDAERMAAGVYVTYEGGSSTIDVVVALGRDGTVSCHGTDTVLQRNLAELDAIHVRVAQLLHGGDLAGALQAAAGVLARLR